jgi:hypothetical protein
MQSAAGMATCVKSEKGEDAVTAPEQEHTSQAYCSCTLAELVGVRPSMPQSLKPAQTHVSR